MCRSSLVSIDGFVVDVSSVKANSLAGAELAGSVCASVTNVSNCPLKMRSLGTARPH